MKDWNLKDYLCHGGRIDANTLMNDQIDKLQKDKNLKNSKDAEEAVVKVLESLKLDLDKKFIKTEDYDFYLIYAKAYNETLDDYIKIAKILGGSLK